jgi:ElaA protein
MPDMPTAVAPSPPAARLPVAVHWRLRAFDDLAAWELARILRARQEVFALEQQCIYLDVDGADESSHHLAAWALDPSDPGARTEATMAVPLAVARIVAPGVKYADASIGRIVTTGPARGTGLGRELVARALAACAALHPGHAVRISAQSQLERFYQGFGFTIESDRYLEDGIPHTEMLWRAAPR